MEARQGIAVGFGKYSPLFIIQIIQVMAIGLFFLIIRLVWSRDEVNILIALIGLIFFLYIIIPRRLVLSNYKKISSFTAGLGVVSAIIYSVQASRFDIGFTAVVSALILMRIYQIIQQLKDKEDLLRLALCSALVVQFFMIVGLILLII